MEWGHRTSARTRRLRPAGLVCGLMALVCLGGAGTSAAEDAPRRNVLFLVADDLNCDLGCYDHRAVQSPHIDALAHRGVQFDRAYCQFPLCSPSRSSFLTGLRPQHSQILTNPRRDKATSSYTTGPHFRDHHPDLVTLTQHFRNHGYFAARVGKLYHFGVPGQIGTSGLDDPLSWDLAINPMGRDKTEEPKIFSFTPGRYGGTLSWLAMDGVDRDQTDGIGATEAIALLEQRRVEQRRVEQRRVEQRRVEQRRVEQQRVEQQRDKPFFLAIGFYRPHTPYVAVRKYFDMYPTARIEFPELSEDDKQREPEAAYRLLKYEREMTDKLRREAMQAYWATITFMDAQVGRVVDALKRLGLAENTIIVMTSDHGYHMYEHGLWQKLSLFENSARVPLIIVDPTAAHGVRTTSLAELVDLYPTLAELCGLPLPEHLDGVSLSPVLHDPTVSVKDAAFTELRRGNQPGYSIRTDRWSYVLWNDGKDGEQLFDHDADPLELNDLADDPQHAAVVSELKHRIHDEWR